MAIFIFNNHKGKELSWSKNSLFGRKITKGSVPIKIWKFFMAFAMKGGGHHALEGGQYRFGQTGKFHVVFTCDIYRLFGIFHPKFDE